MSNAVPMFARAAQIGVGLVAAAMSPTTSAQVVYEQGPYRLTVEAFANLTGAVNGGEDNVVDSDDADGRIDTEARFLGLYKTEAGYSFGGRVTVRADTDEELELGERSLLALGPWGRVEIGKRRGLPDILTGYGPNAYQFVSAEYGPASGRSLDPDGGLQSAFLADALAGEINRLTGLGVTASFFFDESAKIIYVSPKKRGWLGGVSYSPEAEESDGDFNSLVQAGLVYEKYWQQNVLRIGGTYAFADGDGRFGDPNASEDLHSVSAGASFTHDDDLTFGASFTYNGDTGLAPDRRFDSAAYGYAFSVNYNNGPWTLGAFYQSAQSEGDAFTAGTDELGAIQFGASYRINTKVRIYGAVYLYDFDNEGGAGVTDEFDGEVLLLGARVAL